LSGMDSNGGSTSIRSLTNLVYNIHHLAFLVKWYR